MSISLALLAFFLALADLAPGTMGLEAPLSFTFEQFHKNGTLDSAIALHGDAVVEGSAVRMDSAGKILYRKPVNFLWGNHGGFSTYFSFSISPSGSNNLSFFVSSANWHLFRLSYDVLVVKFTRNASGSCIGIRVGRKLSPESCNSSNVNLVLSSGKKHHAWIDYDGVSKRIEVRLSKSRALKPASSLISCKVGISSFLQEASFVGISSSSHYSNYTEKNSTLGSCIYAWSFLVKHGAPYLLHSEPLDPRLYLVRSQDESRVYPRNSYRRANIMAWLFGLVCGVLVAFMMVFVRNAIYRRSPVTAVEYPLPPVQFLYEKTVMDSEKYSKETPM